MQEEQLEDLLQFPRVLRPYLKILLFAMKASKRWRDIRAVLWFSLVADARSNTRELKRQ